MQLEVVFLGRGGSRSSVQVCEPHLTCQEVAVTDGLQIRGLNRNLGPRSAALLRAARLIKAAR